MQEQLAGGQPTGPLGDKQFVRDELIKFGGFSLPAPVLHRVIASLCR